FISIDCGISEGSDYKDESTTISYTSDAGYIDTGTNHNISSDYMSADVSRRLSNLRSFPDGIKNCYTINPAQAGGDKYLIRASFKYGNYDSKNQPPEFALYVDGDQWHTIRFNASDFVRVEIIHNVPATTAYIHVCLVNIELGTPFVSALELRRLDTSIYNTNSGSLKLFNRIDVGSTTNKTIEGEEDDDVTSGEAIVEEVGVGDLDATDEDLRGVRSGGGDSEAAGRGWGFDLGGEGEGAEVAEGEEAWDSVFSEEEGEGEGAGRAAGEEGGVEGGEKGDEAALDSGVGEGGSGRGKVFEAEGGEDEAEEEERVSLVLVA
ncbi:hypothetical protein C3L33_00208, partial [Rhododendron williamsianum]